MSQFRICVDGNKKKYAEFENDLMTININSEIFQMTSDFQIKQKPNSFSYIDYNKKYIYFNTHTNDNWVICYGNVRKEKKSTENGSLVIKIEDHNDFILSEDMCITSRPAIFKNINFQKKQINFFNAEKLDKNIITDFMKIHIDVIYKQTRALNYQPPDKFFLYNTEFYSITNIDETTNNISMLDKKIVIHKYPSTPHSCDTSMIWERTVQLCPVADILRHITMQLEFTQRKDRWNTNITAICSTYGVLLFAIDPDKLKQIPGENFNSHISECVSEAVRSFDTSNDVKSRISNTKKLLHKMLDKYFVYEMKLM